MYACLELNDCPLNVTTSDYDPRTDPTLSTCSLLVLRGEAHANRRRIWNRGMSSESLKEYESILEKRVAQLVDRLGGLSGSIDIAEWFSYFTYALNS